MFICPSLQKTVILHRISYIRNPTQIMRRYFTIGLFIGFACAVYAQEASVTGIVMDGNRNESIIGANVLVVGSKEGTITDMDGRFSLTMPVGMCELHISMIGYKPQTVDVCDKQNIEITLYEDTLFIDEVLVEGTRVHTKIEGGALVTHIEGSYLQEVGSLEEMLSRVPGMQRSGERLEVIGKGEPVYYINGRKVLDMVELKRVNSRQIERVEVITNPGAEYDGEIMAVVRIITRNDFADGLGVEITGRYEHSLDYWRSNIDPSITANLRYRIKNVELKAGLNFWHTSVTDISSFDQQSWLIQDDAKQTFNLNGNKDFRYRGYNLNYLLGFNWAINKNHSLSVEAMIEQQLNDTTIVLVDNSLSRNGVPLESLHTETHTRAFAPNCGLIGGWTNTQYTGKIGKAEIGAQFDTYNYRYTERNRIDESNQILFSLTQSQSQLYVVKAYGAYTIGKGQLRVGTELSFFHRFYSNENNLSGIITFNEDMYKHIYAGYAEYLHDWDKYGTLVVGLRYEHEAHRIADHLKDSVFRRHENHVFPSLSYDVRIKGVQLGISYAMKTRRPEFEEMNDAVIYDSRYMLSQGNSKLQSEIKHELSFQLRYLQLTAGVNYEHRSRAILADVSLLNEGKTVLFHLINHPQPIQQISTFVNYKPVWGFYHPNWTASMTALTHQSYIPVGNFSLTNAFVLKHSWQLELNYHLITPGHPSWNTRRTACSHDLSVAVQKSFLTDDALTLRLEAKDILRMTQQEIMVDYDCSLLHQFMLHDNRRICLSLRYSL